MSDKTNDVVRLDSCYSSPRLISLNFAVLLPAGGIGAIEVGLQPVFAFMISTAHLLKARLRRFCFSVLPIFFLLLVPDANAGPFISEFMADNQHTLADED